MIAFSGNFYKNLSKMLLLMILAAGGTFLKCQVFLKINLVNWLKMIFKLIFSYEVTLQSLQN